MIRRLLELHRTARLCLEIATGSGHTALERALIHLLSVLVLLVVVTLWPWDRARARYRARKADQDAADLEAGE